MGLRVVYAAQVEPVTPEAQGAELAAAVAKADALAVEAAAAQVESTAASDTLKRLQVGNLTPSAC